ncbi:MAG: glycoside hydrolase family 30 protein [Janthinobacterium lividum]
MISAELTKISGRSWILMALWVPVCSLLAALPALSKPQPKAARSVSTIVADTLKTPEAYPLPVIKQAIVYVTARDTGDRLHAGSPLSFNDLPQPDENTPTVMIDPTRRFQTIVGFGGSFTDAAAETYAKLPPAKQQEVIAAYFSPETGIGYTLGRTSINSCDFSSDTYSYDDTLGDVALAHFSIAHDLKCRVPFIKAALAASHNHISLFGSPWSPPAWMKTNNDMAHGGKLKPEDRKAWANYYVRFVQEYRKQGISIWGLTVQNEPMSTQSWESCLYTAADERDFVRDYLGPALHQSGLAGVKLMIWDHNRGIMYQRAQTVYEDPAAAKYVWGTAYHWYTGDHFDNPQAVHEAFPDKSLLFTEGTTEGLTTDPAEEWSRGEQYAKSILLDLSHWSSGWTDWNLIVNQQGGPNHVGNYCSAPIIANTDTGTLHYSASYYVMGQFSKFIRPGARRIADTSNDDGLQSVAFINPDNTIAVVVLNLSDQARDYYIWIAGRAVAANSPAHSIETASLKP